MPYTLSILTAACFAIGAYAQTRSEYDYIVCGGGTAGLTVANKLTEQSDVTVLVVEAGDDSPADWAYPSVPQTFVDDRVMSLRAGRGVGGSSQINGKAYIRPEKSSIDDWGTANNANWSWDTLFPFYKSSEGLKIPSTEQEALGYRINPEFHGTNGSVKTSFPAVGSAEFYDILVNTFDNVTIPEIEDCNGGDARGLSTWPGTYSIAGQREQSRSGAKENYYLPVQDRTNLELLRGTTCLRLIWGDDGSSNAGVSASGVEISSANSQITVNATREIILSAGSYRSPGILEYSGVGNPEFLSNSGIETVVDLPGVGENLQDQMVGSFTYTRDNETAADVVFPTPIGDEITTPYIAHVTNEDVFGPLLGEIQTKVKNSLPDLAQDMAARTNGSLTADQISKSLQVQYNALFVDNVPTVEILSRMAQNNDEINIEFWPLIPLTRGNVHISGGNANMASSKPNIDNNWGQVDYDWELYIASAKFVRNLFATAPLTRLVSNETRPGFGAVPLDAGDEEWKSFWGPNFRAGWHPIGSCAMLPRSWGGVVDGDLKVYGTANVRVVDGSVIPFNLAGHPTSTIYALAERAAYLIVSGESG